MQVALVNTNRVRPPIAPLGLEYVAEALAARGHTPVILDLAWTDDVSAAIDAFFQRCEAPLVGITVRNTDDCAFATRHSFLGELADVTRRVRSRTDGHIVLGGVGFSVLPRTVLTATEADAGIRGEGEFSFPELADRIEQGLPIDDVPGLIRRGNAGAWHGVPVRFGDLSTLPPRRRDRVDNVRYFAEGGQAAVETSRGCQQPCTFCADPVAQGRAVRFRPPGAVADEVEALLAQGIDCFHTADSEFNLSKVHADAVCDTLVRRGLADHVQWYAYALPTSFSRDTARSMKRAGCIGINFSVDHGDPRMLRRLGRTFSPQDILDTARYCAAEGIAVMFDLLLGAPGETRESIASAVDLMKRSQADRIGIGLGVRVWPETALASELLTSPLRDGLARDGLPRAGPARDPLPRPDPLRDGLVGGTTEAEPLFYLEPTIATDIAQWIASQVGDDPRFLCFDPDEATKNYNYSDNQILENAVRAGHRGAYWDILRRLDATAGRS